MIECYGCETRFEGTQEEVIEDEGWKIIDGETYCGQCLEDMGEVDEATK